MYLRMPALPSADPTQPTTPTLLKWSVLMLLEATCWQILAAFAGYSYNHYASRIIAEPSYEPSYEPMAPAKPELHC